MLRDWKKSEEKGSVILRHDVDTQIDAAVQMATLENENNINATYFIRLHSHGYNPLCLKDFDKIWEIKNMGHEIGLHYESDFYHLINKPVCDFLKKEINILEDIFDIAIESICPHEPTRTKSFYIDSEKNLTQAYDNMLFEKFKYISDSSCTWRDGSFYENLTKEDLKNLYVLTHPYWWYNITPIENY
jgi:hypothetical protein